MCCSATDYIKKEINGNCPDCGMEMVNGDAYEQCYYSSTECDLCGWSPCDGSC